MIYTSDYYIIIAVCFVIALICSIIIAELSRKHGILKAFGIGSVLSIIVLVVVLVTGEINRSDWRTSSTALCHDYNVIAKVSTKNQHLEANAHKTYKQWKYLPSLKFNNPRIGRMRLSTYLKFKKQRKESYRKYQIAKQKMGNNLSNMPLPSTFRSNKRRYQSMHHWHNRLFIKPSVRSHDDALVRKAKARITPADARFIKKHINLSL